MFQHVLECLTIIIINNNLFTYSARVPLKDAHRRITHYKNELITKFTILAYKMVQQTMYN